MKVGDKVRYKDINLWDYRGVVTGVGRTERGGDCTVRWNRHPMIDAEECQFNLEVVK